jgi:hypothetical protein
MVVATVAAVVPRKRRRFTVGERRAEPITGVEGQAAV